MKGEALQRAEPQHLALALGQHMQGRCRAQAQLGIPAGAVFTFTSGALASFDGAFSC